MLKNIIHKKHHTFVLSLTFDITSQTQQTTLQHNTPPHSKTQNGLVKIMNGRYGSMTADEKAATEMLKIEGSESSVTDRSEEKLGYFDTCKRRKISNAEKESIYID